MDEKKDGLHEECVVSRNFLYADARLVHTTWRTAAHSGYLGRAPVSRVSGAFQFTFRNHYRRIRDEMVNIMTALPPPNAQPTTQVCNENADQRVDGEVVRNTPVASVVRREHDLLPEKA